MMQEQKGLLRTAPECCLQPCRLLERTEAVQKPHQDLVTHAEGIEIQVVIRRRDFGLSNCYMGGAGRKLLKHDEVLLSPVKGRHLVVLMHP